MRAVGLLFGFPVGAHPGSGIALDAQGRVFFAEGSVIVMIETNGVARAIVHDRKNELMIHFDDCPLLNATWLKRREVTTTSNFLLNQETIAAYADVS